MHRDTHIYMYILYRRARGRELERETERDRERDKRQTDREKDERHTETGKARKKEVQKDTIEILLTNEKAD